jgi:DNA polymerase III sliding clamp (beta) subunit (PCNA family)
MNTEITLPVSELKTALPGLNKVVSRKTTLPVLQTVKVSRQRNGQVTLQGTDLDTFVTYTLKETQDKQPIELLVPLEQLNKAFKCSGPKDEVALICEEKNVRLRYTIAGTPVLQPVTLTKLEEWPPVPQLKTESFKLDAQFGPALRQALESCSDDPSRYVLRGACLDVTDKKCHYVVGTNGRALFSANSFTFPFKKSIIIPDSKFLNAGDLLDEDPCFMQVESKGKGRNATTHISLQTSRWQFITKEIDGEYPNWKQIIPNVNGKWTVVKLGPPAISQMLQVIPKLPGNEDPNYPVRLRIEKCIWVEGRNKDDKDWTKVAIPDITVTGKAQTISLNRNYLVQALKFGLDEFAVEDECSPLVFVKAGKKFIIMPIREDSAAPKPPVPSPQPTAPKPEVAQTSSQPTKERTNMPRVAKTTPATPQPPASNNGSAIKELLGNIDQIKESVKTVLTSLSNVAGKLKAAEKEKRVSEKEIEAIRKQLRRIQTVTI